MTVLNNPERQSVLIVLCCDPISNSRIVPAWSFDCANFDFVTSFEASRETVPHLMIREKSGWTSMASLCELVRARRRIRRIFSSSVQTNSFDTVNWFKQEGITQCQKFHLTLFAIFHQQAILYSQSRFWLLQ